jgi:hypothetical protein
VKGGLCYFATFYFHTVLLGALMAESEMSWILSWFSWFESVAMALGKKCCGLRAAAAPLIHLKMIYRKHPMAFNKKFRVFSNTI